MLGLGDSSIKGEILFLKIIVWLIICTVWDYIGWQKNMICTSQIVASYTTTSGETKTSLLLTSGWWVFQLSIFVSSLCRTWGVSWAVLLLIASCLCTFRILIYAYARVQKISWNFCLKSLLRCVALPPGGVYLVTSIMCQKYQLLFSGLFQPFSIM